MIDDALKEITKFKYLGIIFRETGKNKKGAIQRVKEAKIVLK